MAKLSIILLNEKYFYRNCWKYIFSRRYIIDYKVFNPLKSRVSLNVRLKNTFHTAKILFIFRIAKRLIK